MENNREERLIEENKQLKKVLCICLNKPLVKRLTESMKRIHNGEYLTEQEFFKNSPQITA